MRKIGIGRLHLQGLLTISMLVSLTGCGWLFGSGTPTDAAKARPGAERQVAPSNALPSAGGGRGYDAAAVPVDESRTGPKIGSILPDKGGQKAQLDAAAKEAAERDKAAREAREKDMADRKEREAKETKDAPSKPPTAAVGTITYPPDQNASSPPAQSPQTQGPPPAPVTTEPIAPAAPPPADQKS